MERYKICPVCQTKNEPTMLECMNCEADLTGVKISDSFSEQQDMRVEQEMSVDQEPTLVRVCDDCGTKNPPNARKCSACGVDISDIVPESDRIQKSQKFVFSSIDGEYSFKVPDADFSIGREAMMSEYLSSKIYVSRIHAKISHSDGGLFIENLSNTNFTYVNNERIREKKRLNDGDLVGLGGMEVNGNRQKEAAYFKVRVI